MSTQSMNCGSILSIVRLTILTVMLLCSTWNGVHGADTTGYEKEILAWEPPKGFREKFPYYTTGLDRDGSPVWIIPYGSWDVRTVAEGTDDMIAELDKYVEQMWEVTSTSPKRLSNDTHSVQGWLGIGDVDGFDNRQLAHFPTVNRFAVVVRHFVASFQRHHSFKKAIIINSNYLFQTMWNLVSPLLGPLRPFVELHGTNVAKWKPILLKHIPAESLPKKYGGSQVDTKS